MSRFTHAIVARIPADPVFDQCTRPEHLDLNEARREMELLCDKLRECGLDVVELEPEDSAPVSSLWVDDQAVVINGTALVTRPTHRGRSKEVMALLQEYTWQIFQTPEKTESGAPIVLEGSDVLFTGKEIFVGVRKNGTNFEGATTVAKTFADFATIPIPIDGTLPLKYFVSVASHDKNAPVLSVGNSKEAHNILHRIEREATFRYTVIRHDHDAAVNCLHINNFLIHQNQWPDENERFGKLNDKLKLVPFGSQSMLTLGGQLSQYVLLVRKFKQLKRLW